MNTLLIATFVSMVAFSAASYASLSGTVVAGPSGVVTNKGAIGPYGSDLGHGLGLGVGGLGLGVGGLGLGVGGLGYGLGARGLGLGVGGLGYGLGHGAVIAAPVLASPISYATQTIGVAPVKVAALTAGSGSIAVSAHGAAIRGPPTVPVVVAGPSGKIAADGLWGPTANVGQGYGHGW